MLAALKTTNPAQKRRLRAAAAAAAVMALPLAAAALNNRSASATTSNISGTVWADDDHSGTQNGAEAGVAGVTVTAYIANGSGGETAAGSTTTDSSGNYSISTVADNVSVHVEFTGSAVIPVGTAKRLAELTPGSELFLIPNTQHMTVWDGTGGLAALQEFLLRYPMASR